MFLRNQALIGLVLMSVGSGGIMACDVSLGADQFRLPQQQAEIITGETMPRDSCILNLLLGVIQKLRWQEEVGR